MSKFLIDRKVLLGLIHAYFNAELDSFGLDDRLSDFSTRDALCKDITDWLYLLYDDTKKHFWFSFFDRNVFRTVVLWGILLSTDCDWERFKSENKDSGMRTSLFQRDLFRPDRFDWNVFAYSPKADAILEQYQETQWYYPPISNVVIDHSLHQSHFPLKKIRHDVGVRQLKKLVACRDAAICQQIYLQNKLKSITIQLPSEAENASTNLTNRILPNDSALIFKILLNDKNGCNDITVQDFLMHGH